mgnify:CR=1 FL=1
MIDLTRLKAFIYAAESLSFSEAARQLHLTQPTVSHHLKVHAATRQGYLPASYGVLRVKFVWEQVRLKWINIILR